MIDDNSYTIQPEVPVLAERDAMANNNYEILTARLDSVGINKNK